MGKYLRNKATGKIGEWQSNPTAGTLISNASSTPAESEEIEATYEEWQTARSADPEVIAEELRNEDETILSNQKVIVSVMFDMFNMIRVLEGNPTVTQRQFLDNLKGRR